MNHGLIAVLGRLQGFESDALWGSTPGTYSAAAVAAHQKLAAVFTCISLGMGKGPVSADEVALMSPEDVFLFRQQYSSYLGRLFSRGAQSEGSAAHAELLQIVDLWADCEAHLWEHCPQTVHGFAAFAQRQEDERGVMPNLLKWQSILVQLGLTPAQKSALKQAHRRLFDQLLNVTAERFHVSAMLKENCPNPTAGNTWQGSRTFLRVREAHKRLSASIRSEHTLMCDAHLAFRQVATPVQQAMCDMLAHPGAFDIVALLNLLRSGH
ncbi:hypothetical protein COCOBI_05-6650 [Coccomyxa sp. Obi]|nr:hypothetical protein COCOBI_05-6650 [Coccomyxa sp. Obi]